MLLADEGGLLPKLADFGIAKILGEQSGSVSETSGLLGTVDYMSPEQVKGQPADPRSDLYAFGCLIFKMWAGRPPFLGSTFERLSARLHEGAPALRTLAKDTPAELDELTRRLLQPEPSRRPQSALEVGRVLAKLLARRGGALAERPLWLAGQSPRSVLYQPSFVGRLGLVERLGPAAQAALSGSPAAPALLAVCGEAGLGKSALLRVVRRRLEAAGVTVLAVRVPADSPGPLAPFSELSRQVASRAGEVAPSLHGFGRPMQDGLAALHGQAMALAEPLKRLRQAGPLAILLEDLHDATDSALLFLRELLRELWREPSLPRPLLLCTLRPSHREQLLAHDSVEAPICVIDLEPLDAGELALLAASMLGSEAELPGQLLQHLMHESRGNPLLAQSTLRALADQGSLQREEGGWRFMPQAPTDAVLAARLLALSAGARRIVDWAAVAGMRFDVDLLVTASGLPEDQVLDGLDEALRKNIVHPLREAAAREQLDTYEFEHARLVDVLRLALPEAAHRHCHAAMARALERRPSSSAALLAHHHAEGGQREQAVRWLLLAGEQALGGHDYAAAHRCYQDALAGLDALPEGERGVARERLSEGLAEAQIALGQAQEAVAALTALVKSHDPDHARKSAVGLRARRLRKLGLARLRLGDTAGAMTVLERALEVLGDRLPQGRVMLFVRLAFDALLVLVSLLRWQPSTPIQGRLPEPLDSESPSRQCEERALLHRELALLYRWVNDERTAAHHFAFARAAARHFQPAHVVDSCAAVAVFLAVAGWTWLGSWVERRTRALASSHDDRHGLARVNLLRGGADMLLRNDERGLDLLRQGVLQAQGLADPLLFAWALNFTAWAEILGSRFAEAARDLEDAMQIVERLQITWLRADTSCAQALIESIQGDFDKAAERARSLLSADVRLALPAVEAVATEVLGGIAFMTGRYRDASALFERAHLLYVSHHLVHGWGFLMQIERSEALLLQADEEGPDAVPALTSRLREHARLIERRLGGLPSYRGCALVLRGVYAARSGRPDVARRLFERALHLRPPPRTTYIDGWVLWRIAFERHRLGEPAASVQPLLQQVEDINARSGMRGMAQFLTRARGLYGV